ncbi:hypothetical protein [Bradyrhizobium sp. CCGUVB14]|jgi:hypothetical protein|uniref:hypothetical protein n=1 Tax=Bradyrhizobium sp. CCGUVB14 TaxID=2949628 RepID=UPI0020B3FE4B|nr:hypothetical protein [Bradyrhizobium sp. CCGUVB14]MCP3442317.1 hypothetical protein [Bradyrhizobium sp. CCGUVB14]
MKDMQVQLEKLRAEAADCARVAKLATDEAKRELFTKLSEHFSVLASEVQKAIDKVSVETGQKPG